MKSLKTLDINIIVNIKVNEVRNYKKGINNLIKSDVLKFILENGSWIAIRAQGT